MITLSLPVKALIKRRTAITEFLPDLDNAPRRVDVANIGDIREMWTSSADVDREDHDCGRDENSHIQVIRRPIGANGNYSRISPTVFEKGGRIGVYRSSNRFGCFEPLVLLHELDGILIDDLIDPFQSMSASG